MSGESAGRLWQEGARLDGDAGTVRPEKAYGTLMMEEQLTDVVISENRGGLGNELGDGKPHKPPTISMRAHEAHLFRR